MGEVKIGQPRSMSAYDCITQLNHRKSMRAFLTKLIMAFAKFVTCGMNATRREDTFLRVVKALQPSRIVESKTSRGTLYLVADSHRASGINLFDLEEYEPDTIGWIFSMPDNSCFWDIGSNVGIIGLLACLNATNKVVAFEPVSLNYSLLNKNIELNGFGDRFRAYSLAFAESTHMDSINVSSTKFASIRNSFGGEVDSFGRLNPAEFQQGALGYSIDDFVRFFSPPMPTHIKIDVDGLEPQILRGGKQTFSNPNVKSMIVEVEEIPGSGRRDEIIDLMHQYGFMALPKESPKFRNEIFVRTSD